VWNAQDNSLPRAAMSGIEYQWRHALNESAAEGRAVSAASLQNIDVQPLFTEDVAHWIADNLESWFAVIGIT